MKKIKNTLLATLLVILMTVVITIPALAATVIETEGIDKTVTFIDGKDSVTINGVPLTVSKVYYSSGSKAPLCVVAWSSKHTFSQSGTLKVWIERNGIVISEIATYVTHGGGMRGGNKNLTITDATALNNLELKASFIPGTDYKIYNPQSIGADGYETNILTTTNGYEFAVDMNQGSAWVGHPIDAEYAFWYVEGMKFAPIVNLFNEDSSAKAGTFTITLSSVKANYSYTTTVTVDNANKGRATSISLDSADNLFTMPAIHVDDLKLSVSFAPSK